MVAWYSIDTNGEADRHVENLSVGHIWATRSRPAESAAEGGRERTRSWFETTLAHTEGRKRKNKYNLVNQKKNQTNIRLSFTTLA